MLDQIPPDLKVAAPGLAGSIVAMFFMKRQASTMAGMFIGGCATAYYTSHYIAQSLDLQKYEGMVGFLVGLFGMALIAKVFDTIEAINPQEIWQMAKDRLRALMGAKGGDQ